MKHQFDLLRTNRKLVLGRIKDFSLEQLHTIPDGFNNHLAWNTAHLVVTQQLLHYRLSGLDCYVSDDLIDKYRKGTVPTETFTADQWAEVKELMVSLPDKLEADYANGVFKEYKNYPTSTGFVLDHIDTAISFNNFHEGIHLGSVLAISKLV